MAVFDMGLGVFETKVCIKRKFRWMFYIPNVSGDGIDVLPPQKSARPSLSFKEMEVQHLTETVYYPGKPDWKPISLVLYDIVEKGGRIHPVFNWLISLYNPGAGKYTPGTFKQNATLHLLDGCGNTVELWQFENAWPNTIEWGDLDMSNSEIVTADLTLRYDRAYYVG